MLLPSKEQEEEEVMVVGSEAEVVSDQMTWKASNLPAGQPKAEASESLSTPSALAWGASDFCDDGQGVGAATPMDCDPGSHRLRSLLREAELAHLTSSGSSSSCSDMAAGSETGSETTETDDNERVVDEVVEGPSCGFVARAHSARKLVDQAMAAQATKAACGVGAGADAGGQDADEGLGQAALTAALEAVLLCPPQVLAKTSISSQGGQGSFLTSLLVPSSTGVSGGSGESRDGCSDGSDPRYPAWDWEEEWADGGEGFDDEDDAAAAADAVAAALAWSFPSPRKRLSCVQEEIEAKAEEEEGGGFVARTSEREEEEVEEETAVAATHDAKDESKVMVDGAREVIKTASANEEEGEKEPEAGAVFMRGDSGSTVSVTPMSEGEQFGDGNGDTDASSSGERRGCTTKEMIAAVEAASSCQAAGNNTSSNYDGIMGRVRRCSFASAGSSAPTEGLELGPGHRRSVSKDTTDEDGASAAACVREREKLLLRVFGSKEGVAAVATIGRSDSCEVFLAAVERVASLPPLTLGQSSQEGGEEGSSGDNVDVRSTMPEGGGEGEGAAPSSLPEERKLPLCRVGCEETGGNGARSTPYRYRRLAGSGREWPPGVDPARREEWLCPVEFTAVFAMTFAEFEALPSWKRVLMKQEVRLF